MAKSIWIIALVPLLAFQAVPASAGCRWSPELKEQVCSRTSDGPGEAYKDARQKPDDSTGLSGRYIRRMKSATTGGCLIKGVRRTDIADSDCEEAQRTGCVRSMLTSTQYVNCLKANREARVSGQECIIAGTVRRDLSALDCEEAKATGCVRRLLTAAQYTACLNAQPYGRR